MRISDSFPLFVCGSFVEHNEALWKDNNNSNKMHSQSETSQSRQCQTHIDFHLKRAFHPMPFGLAKFMAAFMVHLQPGARPQANLTFRPALQLHCQLPFVSISTIRDPLARSRVKGIINGQISR